MWETSEKHRQVKSLHMKEKWMNFVCLHDKLVDMAYKSMKADKRNGFAPTDRGKHSGGVQTRPWPRSLWLNNNAIDWLTYIHTYCKLLETWLRPKYAHACWPCRHHVVWMLHARSEVKVGFVDMEEDECRHTSMTLNIWHSQSVAN